MTEERKDERTLQQLAREALDVQDACNLLGVSKAYARALQRLWELMDRTSMDEHKQHPITILWTSKLNSMVYPDARFSEAYDACEKLAAG